MSARVLSRRRLAALAGGAAAVLFVIVGIAVIVNPAALSGTPGLPATDALGALFGEGDEVARAIVWRARVPRVIVAALVGASLAAAGAMLQLLLRNPLADPFVLGVSSGAAFGSVLGLALGLSLSGGAHPVAAILGAAVAGLVVHALGRERGRLSPERTVLAGVVLSYLLAAAIMWLISLSSAVEAQRYLFWLMGSLASVSGHDAAALAVAMAVAAALALPVLPALDLLLVSDDHATGSGVRVERVKGLTFAAAALLTGASVAVAGSIGFVGLVVPHSLRLLGARDARVSVPVSALAGGSFLVLVDLASRALGEVPVGVVTATFGAPFFLFLLARRRAP